MSVNLTFDDHVQYAVSAPNHSHGLNYTSHEQGHNHMWTNVAPSAGWVYYDGNTNNWKDFGNITIGTDNQKYDSIYVNDKNLTEVIEDMAFVLRAMSEKYDLKEVKPMIENEAIKVWADAGEKRILGEKKEKKEDIEQMDEKLFEI